MRSSAFFMILLATALLVSAASLDLFSFGPYLPGSPEILLSDKLEEFYSSQQQQNKEVK